MKLLLKFFTLVTFLLALGIINSAQAQSVNLTANVNDTSIVISGYTIPNAFITFRENNGIIGTTSSNSAGFFNKTFPAQSIGIHIIDMWATGEDNVSTPLIEFNILLFSQQIYEINNVYLPTTIFLNSENFTNTDIITITGFGKPNTHLILFLEGVDTKQEFVTTDATGKFTNSIPANTLAQGTYKVYSELSIPGPVSNDTRSLELDFTVTKNPITATPIVAVEVPFCNYFYQRICSFDEDDKGFLEVATDVNVYLEGFLRFFNRNLDNMYDINQDSVVDSRDLSIVLYYSANFDYQINTVRSRQISDDQPEGVLGVSDTRAAESEIVYFVGDLITKQLIILIILGIIFSLLVIFRKKFIGNRGRTR